MNYQVIIALKLNLYCAVGFFNFITYNDRSKKRNDMKDKIFKVAKNHTENIETAMQLTNELCVLLSVSKCDCPPLVACDICGEEKNLDGDFWKNKKKHDC